MKLESTSSRLCHDADQTFFEAVVAASFETVAAAPVKAVTAALSELCCDPSSNHSSCQSRSQNTARGCILAHSVYKNLSFLLRSPLSSLHATSYTLAVLLVQSCLSSI